MNTGDELEHFKGNKYVVWGEGKHSETGEDLVAYQSLTDGKLWFRPPHMFEETVPNPNDKDSKMKRFWKTGERVIFLDQYQELAMRTAGSSRHVFEEGMAVTGLGLPGEAGEVLEPLLDMLEPFFLFSKALLKATKVAEIVKKTLFHKHALDKEKMEKEVGDTFWYVSLGASTLKMKLSDIATANIAKLRKRYKDGDFKPELSINRTE
jgi:NTP pyrophosphatase (non-canonical NTP hydrolase)